VLERSTGQDRSAAARVGSVAAAVGLRLWAKAMRRPVDTLAILSAAAASLVVLVNALFLQSGMHPAPFFANTPPAPPPVAVQAQQQATTPPTAKSAEAPAPKSAEPTASVRPPATARTPQTVSARRNDLIAELIGSPSRVAAVQRALTELHYGQLRPSGVLDGATSVAIEKFQREHKLPVTGLLSERLLSELAGMSGHPLD